MVALLFEIDTDAQMMARVRKLVREESAVARRSVEVGSSKVVLQE